MSLGMLAKSLGLMGGAILAGYFLFRKSSTLARIPVFIECLLIFFYVGCMELPMALPSFFESLLGHSIFADYVYPARPDGTRITETWLSARWATPIQDIYLAALVIGIVWAIVNVSKGRERKLNLFALGCGLCWIVVGLYFSLACFPFCV
jgi:hypothetical protein